MKAWRNVGEDRFGKPLAGNRRVGQQVRWSAKPEISELASQVGMLFLSSKV